MPSAGLEADRIFVGRGKERFVGTVLGCLGVLPSPLERGLGRVADDVEAMGRLSGSGWSKRGSWKLL